MTTIEILTEARELISDPKRWTQGAYARDSRGRKVFFPDEDNVCFCALGAVIQTGSNNRSSPYSSVKRLTQAAKKLGFYKVSDVNDGTDHETVLKMFDLAIELSTEN